MWQYGPIVRLCFRHPTACRFCNGVRIRFNKAMGRDTVFIKKKRLRLRTWLPSLSRKHALDGWHYHEGLTGGELTALATEGAVIQRGNKMMFAGYRTYMVAAVMFGLGIAMAAGVTVPEEVWLMLNAIGLGALRAAFDAPVTIKKDGE